MERANLDLVMADSYDKVISALGLDGCRTDRLFGVVEHELSGLDVLQGREDVRVSLNRLPDARRLLLFQFGPRSEGALWPIPCSRANADALGGFLRRAETHLPRMGLPELPGPGMLEKMLEWFMPRQRVEIMPRLVHSYLDCRIELHLLACRSGGHSLRLVARGSRCRFDRSWQWSRSLAAGWRGILAALHDGLSNWPVETEQERTR